MMETIRKNIENQLFIRGSIDSGGPWLRRLQLNFLMGIKDCKAKHNKDTFFNVSCKLDYQEDSDSFLEMPVVSFDTYQSFSEFSPRMAYFLKNVDGDLNSISCAVTTDNRGVKYTFPINHLQLLQTFTYLCAELRSKAYNLLHDGEMDSLEDEVYVTLANRLEGFVQSYTRQFLRVMGIPPLK